MSLHGTCECCGEETVISYETSKKSEQCTGKGCRMALSDGRPIKGPDNADDATLRSLGLAREGRKALEKADKEHDKKVAKKGK